MMTLTRNFSGLLLVLAVVLVSSFTANASTVNCAVGPIDSVSVGNPASPSFTCGGLTFGSFAVTSPSGGAIGLVDINGASFNSVTGEVDLLVNPNLLASQDEEFFYTVTGGVKQLDLSLGGNDAEVTERACLNPIPMGGPLADLCSPASSLLGLVSDFSNDPADPVFSSLFPITSPIYISKDIETGPGDPIGSGQLSEMDQSFEVGGLGLQDTPEPASMLMLGGGLLFVGLLKRRRKV